MRIIQSLLLFIREFLIKINKMKKGIQLHQKKKKKPSRLAGYLARLQQQQQKQGHLIERMRLPQETLQMIGEDALRSPSKFDRLWQYINQSKIDDRYALAASNALTALNLAGYSFSGKDLSEVNAPEANLSNGIFYGTDFTDAKLQNVKFRLACLGNALLVRAHLEGADFGQFQLKEGKTRDYCLAVQGDKAAIGDLHSHSFDPDHERKIHVWSLKERKKICSCNSGVPIVSSIVFTRDAKLLVSSDDYYGYLRIWDTENGELIRTIAVNYILKSEFEKNVELFELKDYEQGGYVNVKSVLSYPDYLEVNLDREKIEQIKEISGWWESRWWLPHLEGCKFKVLEFLKEEFKIYGCDVSSATTEQTVACTNHQGDIYLWNLQNGLLLSFI